MQSVSSEFLTASDATIRRPIGKLEITWTDPIIDPTVTITITPSTENRGSVKSQVSDTITEPSFKYTILDGTWELNSDYHLAPGTAIEQGLYQIGYCGNQVSAPYTPPSTPPHGFSTEEKILIEFDEKTIQGIFVSGNKLLGEYPVEYEIYIRNGSTDLGYIYESQNLNIENYYSGVYANVDNIELIIYSWSAPDTCSKIAEFYTAFVSTYTGDDIISMNLLEERELRDATLPVGNISMNEIDISIQNYDYGRGEWVEDGQIIPIKSDVQDVTYWEVFEIIDDNPVPTLIDNWTCPSEIIDMVEYWYFYYEYTIPSHPENTTIQLYFQPDSGSPDAGKPGDFYSDRWLVKDVVIDPYNYNNPNSLFVNLLRPNRKIKAYLGFILASGAYDYIPIGTFWSNDWKFNENNLSISTDGRDRLGLLKENVYNGSTLWENETLRDIADDVLTFAKANIPMPDLVWDLDTHLDEFTVPYAFFDRKSYFEVLEQISKAVIGQCYMGKDDILYLKSHISNLNYLTYSSLFTKDQYFNIYQESRYREIKNRVNVTYHTYELQALGEIYRSSAAIDIANAETLDPITIEYSNPIKGGSGSIVEETGTASCSIIAEEYYSWGAIITVQNSGGAGTFKIAIDGQELLESDHFIYTIQNSSSILANTLMEYNILEEYLVQNEENAQEIGDGLIDVYKNPHNLIELDYRGNPAIELGDIIRVVVYKRGVSTILRDFIIYKSSLEFDGTLKGKLFARSTLTTGGLGDMFQDSDNGILVYQDSDSGSEKWYNTD